MEERVIFTNAPGEEIDSIAGEAGATQIFVIADTNTEALCLPLLRDQSTAVATARVLTVSPGDANKNIDTATALWRALGNAGATRRSMVVNLGGGMVSDLGGFVASTFKRGMRYINVPTTLLGAVDAAVGGKTGINFGGLKNEIGVFGHPEATIVGTCFFGTLLLVELQSGYGEILKHALLSGPEALSEVLGSNVADISADTMLRLLRDSIQLKMRIVESDPTERGPRKALNFGHTVGHAFEAIAIERGTPVPHGYAVARGCVVEMILSHMQLAMPTAPLYRVAAYVKENYGAQPLSCDDYPQLMQLMRHDKKNASADAINFTLLKNPGEPVTDCTAPATDIETALDIYRDIMGA